MCIIIVLCGNNRIESAMVWSKWVVDSITELFSLQMFYCCCYSVAKLCPTLCNPWNVKFQDPVLPSSRVHSNLCPLSWWCYLTISFLCCLLLLPSSFPSIRVFSNESSLSIRWPKYWSFSFSVSTSSEYWGLIFFRIDWFYLPVVQGTLKSLLQHHNLKAPIFWCSVFMVWLSHPYMTTGKTIALTIQTLVGKVMSLLFNTLSFS